MRAGQYQEVGKEGTQGQRRSRRLTSRLNLLPLLHSFLPPLLPLRPPLPGLPLDLVAAAGERQHRTVGVGGGGQAFPTPLGCEPHEAQSSQMAEAWVAEHSGTCGASSVAGEGPAGAEDGQSWGNLADVCTCLASAMCRLGGLGLAPPGNSLTHREDATPCRTVARIRNSGHKDPAYVKRLQYHTVLCDHQCFGPTAD